MKTFKEVKAKVKELEGWFEGDIIRFLTPYHLEKFNKWYFGE